MLSSAIILKKQSDLHIAYSYCWSYLIFTVGIKEMLVIKYGSQQYKQLDKPHTLEPAHASYSFYEGLS
jgi:hypothetical protein